MEQIYPLCCKTNYVVIMRFCRETRCVEYKHFIRLLKNIVFRVHIAILAKYRVHIARNPSKRYRSRVLLREWYMISTHGSICALLKLDSLMESLWQ